ncbi:MAG: patatin-like phospholipase family protein, partial [Hyphomicrobiales bacterium]|nr:patatin-like phospholipase family protein [Hyphomicrobiales bacterium]
TPSVVAGTSIGALIGGCYAADLLGELKEFALTLTRRRLFSFLDISWGGSGLISGDRLSALLDEHMGEMQFSDMKLPFICIATELLTGHEIWLREGAVVSAMRGSYALPGVFRPAHRDGKWLIDGAVVNPIPVSACRAMGARLVIAVNLNSDAFGGTVIQQGLEQQEADAKSAGARKSAKAKPSMMRQMIGSNDDPGLTTVLVAAFNISQDRLARSRLAGDPPDINIMPRTPDIGLFEFDKAQQAIDAGREAAERALPDIEYALDVLERVSEI